MPIVKLAPRVDSLDAIPEAYRGKYEKGDDGKYVLAAALEFDDAAELKETLRKVREEADTARREAARIKAESEAAKAGVTPEQMAALRKEIEGEYAPTKTELEQARQELRRLKLDTAVKSQLAKAGVLGNRVDTLFKLVADELDLNEKGEPVHKGGKDLGTFITKDLAASYPEFYGTQQKGGIAPPHQQGVPVSGADQEKLLLTNPGKLIEMANAQPAKAA